MFVCRECAYVLFLYVPTHVVVYCCVFMVVSASVFVCERRLLRAVCVHSCRVHAGLHVQYRNK